ncbi:hypothetical protein C9374_012837 [Naegleria lovaniensis]|uniref:50S ribosomal protein L35 n=1 Tax=Naegleria lovaniensis TaxID=51637 RepID=A0AA88GCS8_NAELO|nr:uncharacterized protein C9374_012837 [Naegleria lovaniensis]KAG2373105.1 hypothetical protein C9374_012837 [Naegleria lovaniensis]
MNRFLGVISQSLVRSSFTKRSAATSLLKSYSDTLMMNAMASNPFVALKQSSSLLNGALSFGPSIFNQSNIRFRRIVRHNKLVTGVKKLKTKSSAKKRFRVTASGKIKRHQAGKRHHAWSKNRKRLNRLGKTVFVTCRGDKKKLKRFLNFKI